jgi:hypothetical protein
MKKENKNLSKILLAILILSIFLIPIIVNQHSLYRLKTMDNEDGIQKCADEGFVTREKCEEIYLTLTEEFLEGYEKVSFVKKYTQGFIDSFSYWHYWYSWIIPIILFLVYLKIRKKK